MGKLQSIELYNFKSYRGIQRAEFGSAHFTSIIGPNGSGKSNMMDAISFVLGIRSKELRSNHAKDLIYRNRVAAEHGNGHENGNADPTDAYVMALYIKSDGGEMRLKRAINSNGTSQYLINEKRTTAQEYAAELAKEDILIKAKNFLVFQGDVDHIAAQDSASLCKLFEQISGSDEMKEDCERLAAEKHQESTRQTAVAQDKKRAAQDVKQLQDQKSETERYHKKMRAREKILQEHLLWRLYHCEANAEQKQLELDDAAKVIEQAEEELQTEQSSMEGQAAAHASSKKKNLSVEQKMKKQNGEIDRCKADMVPLKAKIGMIETRVGSEAKRLEQIKREKQKHEATAAKHQRNIDISNKSLQQFEEDTASKLKEGLNITEEDIKEFQGLKDEYMGRTATEQSEMATIMRQQHTVSDELQQLESTKARHGEKHESLTNELEEHQQKSSELTSSINEHNTVRAAKRAELDEIGQQERQRQRQLQELNERLRKTIQELSDYDAVQHESHKERVLRENGGALKRYFPGVQGFIHDLVDSEQEKYRTAVATVIGRHMNSIVTDTSRTAQDCIAYLKDNRMSPMTFIPMDSVDIKPIRSDYRGIARGARLAVETVRYTPAVEPAVQYVCEDTMICDDMQVAKHVRWTKRAHVKTVTLDGSVIHKSNLMTGGSANATANQWSDAKVRNLRNLQDSLKEEIAQVNSGGDNRAEERLTHELTQLEARLEADRAQLAQIKQVVDSRERELKHCKKELKELAPKIEQLESKLASLREQHERVDASIESDQRAIFGEFCQRLGVENFKQFDQNQSSAQQRVAQERDRHEQQLKRLKQLLSLAEAAVKEQDKRIEKKVQEIDKDKVSLAELKEEKLELDQRLEQMDAKMAELQERYDQNKKDVEANRRSVKEYKDKVDAAEKKVEKCRQDAELVRQDMHAFKTNRINILRDVRMEGQTLPLTQGSLEDVSLGVNIEEESQQDEDGDVQMGNEPSAEIVIDYTELASDYKESDEAAVGQGLLDRAESLREELEAARSKVDMQAGDKLTERKQRLTELERDFAEIQQKTKDLTAQYNEVRAKRRDRFMNAFRTISESIQQIYKELTSSPNVPAGGTANMYVEDEEDPWTAGINYGTMPPLKRYQPMEQLSGGEKTMAAMALLFAIHSFRPSPFFVLDEIDAALDNANVASIARYINNHCGPNFQFIVISLKQGLFELSESLVGIHRNQVENSSKALMLDLR